MYFRVKGEQPQFCELGRIEVLKEDESVVLLRRFKLANPRCMFTVLRKLLLNRATPIPIPDLGISPPSNHHD